MKVVTTKTHAYKKIENEIKLGEKVCRYQMSHAWKMIITKEFSMCIKTKTSYKNSSINSNKLAYTIYFGWNINHYVPIWANKFA